MHNYRWFSVFAAIALLATVSPMTAGVSRAGDSRFFPQTGHTVSGPFLHYWESHGGLAQQGYPITEAVQDTSPIDGKTYTMQYFQRSVFEWHPEKPPQYQVLLSLLGVFYYAERYGSKGAPGNAPGQQASTVNPRYFPQTGKTLGGEFRAYWEKHGGLAQQGYPISDEFFEKSELDGKTYRVQYFERAVFEFHPEYAGTSSEVLLSLLGVFYASKR